MSPFSSCSFPVCITSPTDQRACSRKKSRTPSCLTHSTPATSRLLEPTSSLADATPATCYTPSPQPYLQRLPPLEYPGHYEVRRVSRNGGIRWHKQWVNVSQTLGEEVVGLTEIDDGEWDLYLGPLRLGRLHERTMQVEDALGRTQRRPY